jgi:hypothetical protein
MNADWLIPQLLILAELMVAVLVGYGFGRGVRKELHQAIVELREDLKAREELLGTRSKREDKMVKACMERLGVASADTAAPNDRIDLSREAVAVNMEEDRRRRVREGNEQDWEQAFDTRRADALAEIDS